MDLPEQAGDRRYTYRDYVTWDETVRCELIDGEVFDMSPAPRRIHQGILGELIVRLHPLVHEPCRVYAAPFDVRLPDAGETVEESSTVVQPDVSVICDPAKLDDAGCVGAPDLIIEILSPSTASKDQIRKRELYERHGVREYWLIHPTDRTVRIYRLDRDGRYGRDEVFAEAMTLSSSVVKELSFTVEELFDAAE